MNAPRNIPVVYAPLDNKKVASFAQSLGLSRPAAEILIRKGYDTSAKALKFLNPSVSDSLEPLGLKGMRQTVARVMQAIEQGEQITVFGDYDADGIPGTALLCNFLLNARWPNGKKAKVNWYIPHRENEGFGLNKQAIDTIAARGTKVIITIDCGAGNPEEVKYAQAKYGLTMIITDHHQVLKSSPPTPYFVDAWQPGDRYPFKGMCGCGIAYKLVQALAGGRQIPELYDLLAISTIADMVPLQAENRFYAKAGIARIRQQYVNLGLRALAKMAKVNLNVFTEEDVSFRLAPMINAVGRMAMDPNEVVRLLTTSSGSEAQALAAKLADVNLARRRRSEELFVAAQSKLSANPSDVIFVFLPEALGGLVGPVATMISNQFNRPVLVSGAGGRGSGRSIPGVNILDVLAPLAPLMDEYGGHTQACGFAIKRGQIKRFAAAISGVKLGKLPPAQIKIDSIIKVGELTGAFVNDLEKIGPFGVGNESPMFLAKAVDVTETKWLGKDNKHVSFIVSDSTGSARGVAFKSPELIGVAGKYDIVFRPSFSPRSGQVEIMVQSMAKVGR